jgi:hypothetical protein
MPHVYRIFGLLLESELECPELLPAEPGPQPDIRFVYGDVPADLEQPVTRAPRWQTAPGQFISHQEGFGDFYVHDGLEIVMHPHPRVPGEAVRLYLLGTCLSILMHQRRLFVQHTSGIATGRGVVLFGGQSGVGKSTMVSAFLERGYKIVADDMLALTLDAQAGVLALPGFPQVKLMADSAMALGRSTEGLRRVMPGHDKFISPERERFSAEPARLHAIYDLSVADVPAPVVLPLAHTARFNILLNHTWQKATLFGLGVREWHFQTAARIASLTYAARLTRPREPLDVRRTVDLVEADMLREHSPA